MSRPRPHLAWAGGLAAAGLAWYSADSLRHRREEGSNGYELAGEVSVTDPTFMRAAEALTAAPIAVGNRVELLINGDAIFPRYLETIAAARAQPEHHHLRLLEGPDRHRRGRGAGRARDGRGRGQRADRRPGRGQDGPVAAG